MSFLDDNKNRGIPNSIMFKNHKVNLVIGIIVGSFLLLSIWYKGWMNIGNSFAFIQQPKHFTDVLQLGCRKLPDILIIGIEKCGTVALKKFLSVHPNIFITDSRINNKFFNADNKISLSDFTREIPCTPDGKLRLEKIATPGIPQFVKDYIPDVKLIAIVKEPVERTLSHFVHLQSNNILRKNATNFEDFVTEAFEHENFSSPVFYFSFYAERILPWIEVFGHDRIVFLDGDLFVLDPVAELQKAETFLGLEPSITSNDFYYSKSKRFYCIKSLGKKGCLGRRKGRPHPSIEKATRLKLQKLFRPLNEIFFKYAGRYFNWNN